jgi:hypothetical protein
MTDKEKVNARISIIKAVADTIQEMGEAPNGIVYAAMMDFVTFEQYQDILNVIERAGLVSISEGRELLTWIGPKKVA